MSEADPLPDVQIALRLSMPDLELVLAALGARAYSEVAQLVHLIAGQANPQLLAHQRKLELAASTSEMRN